MVVLAASGWREGGTAAGAVVMRPRAQKEGGAPPAVRIPRVA